ncbi:MAG: hypothetical protein GXO70_08175 [Acidobacteria bacterium]|nr:hypothetical protein [Acidobacteriota bacterium]
MRRLGLMGAALFCSLISLNVFAQNVTIPDADFKAFLVANYDTNGDGEIQVSEAEAVTGTMDTPGDSSSTGSIRDLTGIEAFTELTGLTCSNEQLSSLDISSNTKLTTLRCTTNQLTGLDVQANTALKYIYCHENQISSLNLENNINLLWLYCSDNQLTSLDVSKNTNLERLYCYENLITALDLSANAQLQYLYCRDNQLSSLDLSSNSLLERLYCSGNQLTSLNIGSNNLTRFYCYDNLLGSILDVTACASLTDYVCYGNSFTSADCPLITEIEGMGLDSFIYNPQADGSLVDCSGSGTTYVITASAGANGGISPHGSITVNSGANQTFTMTPDSGYAIDTVYIDGGETGNSSTYTFTGVSADHTINVTFKSAQFTITASAGTGGSISPSGSVGVGSGDDLSFAIAADSGYVIDDVLVDGASVGAVHGYTFSNVEADHTIEASFSVDSSTVTITASADAGGFISPSGTIAMTSGGDQSFSISADSGYRINDVLVDGMSVGPVSIYSFTNVTTNHSIHATFKGEMVPVIDDFSVDKTSGDAPLTVEFSVNAHDPDGGSITRYLWRIAGERNTTVMTTIPILSYRFQFPGDYHASVTVTDDEGDTAEADLEDNGVAIDIHVANGTPISIPIPASIQMTSQKKDTTANSRIFAVNELNSATAVSLSALNGNGVEVASATVNVPANGSAELSAGSFDGLDYDKIIATMDWHLLLYSRISTATAEMTAELSGNQTNLLIIPHIAEETEYWDTYAYLSNKNPMGMDVRVAGQSHTLDASRSQTIYLEDLMPADVAVADAWGSIAAVSNDPFSDTRTLSGFEMFVKDGSDGAANELVGRGSPRLYIPHVPEETDVFWTGFALLNPGPDPVTVQATFYDDDGVQVGSESLDIPAKSKIKGLMADLFPDEAGKARWGILDTDQLISGIEIYGTYNAGICGLKLPPTADTWGILPDVWTGEENWTGIVITNVNDADAAVTIRLVGKDGEVKQEKNETVKAMHRFKAVVSDYFSAAVIEGGDTIRYSSDRPVIALEASGDLNRTFMTGLTGSR